jgi:hypothetical protein
MFRRYVSPLLQDRKVGYKQLAESRGVLLHDLLFDIEEENNGFFSNIGTLLPDFTESGLRYSISHFPL